MVKKPGIKRKKPTIRQLTAFKKIVENRGNVSRAMIQSNYKPATAKNPKNLTDSRGFQQMCEDFGLTAELIVGSLVFDIKKKKLKRSAELSLGADILGIKKSQKIGTAVQVNIQELRARYA